MRFNKINGQLMIATVSTLLLSNYALANQNIFTQNTINNTSNIELNAVNSIKKTQPESFFQKVKVADKVTYKKNLFSEMNTAQMSSFSSRSFTINKPGASFIKLHFSHFEIPTGYEVKIANLNGSEEYIYGADPDTRKQITFDISEGDNGKTSFSAFSINSDAVVVTVSKQEDAEEGLPVIEIDYMYEGYSNAHLAALDNGGPSVQSTCGVMERKDVACWESSHPTEYERTRPTAKIFMSGSVCTAWRVGPDNRVFTNNHCVASQSGVANTELWFNYQRTSCNGSQNAAVTKVSGQTMLSTNYDLDYTLLTVNDFASIEGFSYYGLDVRPPVLGERIYISQHGAGNPKELAIESDANSNNLCQVDVALRDGLGDDTDMGYKCDTTGGSSGSPVLAASTNKVIALHHLGGCPSGTNAGVHINQIWPRVSSYFDGIPGNPPTLPPTGNPVASFTFSANELNVTFNNASSDANGSIASNLWDFGDGTTSNTANPTHTYANTGDYNVTLTVTDNEGNTNTVSKTVSVTKVDPVTGLQNGVPVTGLSGSDKEFTYFTAQVPAEATQVTFRISGGTGDADLYTRKGLKPTLSDYDCRPYVGGNNESCVDSNVSEGVYHVGVQAYSDFSNLTLEYTYSSTPNDVYSGSLSGRNDSEIEPDDGQIEVTGSATISAKLTGPQNADFDLEMQQFINGSWKRIDVSQSSSSTENITKTVSSGQYRFKVYSYNGSGNYTLTIEQ